MPEPAKPARCNPTAFIIVICILAVAWYVTSLFGMHTLAFNPTHSAPPGLHVRMQTVTMDSPLQYSTPDNRHLVTFPIPTIVANRVLRHLPIRLAGFLKPVIGLPGDEIRFRDGGYWRNGERFSDALPATAGDGSALPVWTGCQVLGDEVFVCSARIPDSIDSRSFGPVPIGALLGVHEPVVTW